MNKYLFYRENESTLELKGTILKVRPIGRGDDESLLYVVFKTDDKFIDTLNNVTEIRHYTIKK